MNFWTVFGGVILALLVWDMIHEITLTWLDGNTIVVRIATVVALIVVGAVTAQTD